MGILRVLGTLAVASTLTFAGLPAATTATSGAGGDTGARAAPSLASFTCTSDPAHVLGVSGDGSTYRGTVNWVPEHFVSPAGPLWTVTYADGVVRLSVQGMYLSTVPGQPHPLGTMELTAQVTELAPEVTHTGGGPGSGDANDQHSLLRITRALELVGTARVSFDNGHTYEVSGCTGAVVATKADRQSDPKAQVSTGTNTGAWCDPTVVGTRSTELWIDTASDPWWLTLSTYDDNGTPEDEADDAWASYTSVAGASLADLAAGLPVELVGFASPSPPGTDEVRATLTMRWTDLTTSQVALLSGTWTNRSTVTSGPLLGDVAYDDGSSEAVTCLAYSDTYRYVEGGGGSPPTGHPPGNDAPQGAVPLTGPVSVQTSGTALEAEEPNPCTVWDDDPDYRATHTVWFTVTGDGPTTVDTAGSRFDTAIAVYTREDTGGLVPVDGACNDDHRTEVNPGLFALDLQARSTFDAEPGTTYLVQVGGVSSDDNYGALRVGLGAP